jgi:hypothetical protein
LHHAGVRPAATVPTIQTADSRQRRDHIHAQQPRASVRSDTRCQKSPLDGAQGPYVERVTSRIPHADRQQSLGDDGEAVAISLIGSNVPVLQ